MAVKGEDTLFRLGGTGCLFAVRNPDCLGVCRLIEESADLLYHVNLHKQGDAYLYILLEHKSYPDPQTPFQLLRYLVRIWERDSREGEDLRPIVPVVVYHGQERWRAATG